MPDSPQAFFADLGYTLEHHQDERGVHWASLRSTDDADFTVEKYGRGDTAEAAAERARQRWQIEQIG